MDLTTFLSFSAWPFVSEIYSLYLEDYVLETDVWTLGQSQVFRHSLEHAFSCHATPNGVKTDS